MTTGHEELGRRLEGLRADFTALGARAVDTASAVARTALPPAELLDELVGARRAFADLRDAVVGEAAAADVLVESDTLRSLRDLEPVLVSIRQAEEHRALVAAWEEARAQALRVLDRVAGFSHLEEKAFAPLVECQAQAAELRAALAERVPEDLETETAALPGRVRPFADLATLVQGWNVLDDDRCASLEDTITRNFGRPLALATLRGKLGREGETRPGAPRARRRGAARGRAPDAGATGVDSVWASGMPAAPADAGPQPAAASGPASSAPGGPGVSVVGPGVLVPPAAASGAPAGAPVGAPATGGAPRPGMPVAHTGAGPVSSGASGSIVVEIRVSGDKVAVESPEVRKEREERLERLATETARWWIEARRGWIAMRERGTGFADAVRENLRRAPHLLSVPIRDTGEGPHTELAEGYALLLEHVERQEGGFVHEALGRLNPQLTARGLDDSYPLGQELYLYLVAEGRLYKTYPDFVREILNSALPDVDPWVQGGLVETEEETRQIVRDEEPGADEARTETFTEPAERRGPHLFTFALGPLTVRFFTLVVEGELSVPPDVEIRLKANDAPADQAWIAVLPAGEGKVREPRKHRVGGTTLEKLGKEFGGAWIAVFNADPSNDRRYELALTLKRPAPPQARTAAAPPAPEPAPTFFGRPR